MVTLEPIQDEVVATTPVTTSTSKPDNEPKATPDTTPDTVPATGPSRPDRPSWAFTDNFVEEMQKIPLFMTQLPSDMEENEALAALQTLKFDGTPEENALNFKELGNESFRFGRVKYQDAIKYYTQALDQNCSDLALNVACFINRAAVNLELGNYGKVLSDCSRALKLDPSNVKAFFRSSKALLALERTKEAIDCCECGLQIHPDNKSLVDLLAQAKKLKEKLDAIEKKRQERAQAEKDRLDKLTAALEDAKATFTDKAGRPIQPDFKSSRCVRLDPETSRLSWPIVFMYPEFQESDYVEHCDELTTFQDHLDVMFDSPAPWDSHPPQYTPSTIDVYFESVHPTQPTLVKVGTHCTIRKVIAHSKYFITEGIPAFILLQRNSTFAKEFIAKYRK